jgi:rod shape-determining protein MreD
MKILRYFLLAAIALILQSTLLKLVSVGQIQPDVILLVLFLIALLEGSFGATIAGFCTGLVQDIYAPETLGLNALCKSLVGFGLGYCQRGVFMESLAARALILFSAVLVHDILYFQISLWPEVGGALALVVRVGIPTALYTALLGYVVFYLMGRKEKIRPLQESP